MKKNGNIGVAINAPPYKENKPRKYIDSARSEMLADLIAEVFGKGYGSLKQAAAALEMNYDNLRAALKGRRAVPERALETLSEVAASRRIPIPPAQGEGAEEAAAAKMSPYISDMVSRFCKAGWNRDEVVLTLINWAGTDVEKNHGKVAVEVLFRSALAAAQKEE